MFNSADFHVESDRGTASGMLQMTSLLGEAFGSDSAWSNAFLHRCFQLCTYFTCCH
jgi:hypothetical protein